MSTDLPRFDVHDGFRYACRLRGPAAEINPPDWTVDWSDAPWPFKIYEDGRRIALPTAGTAWMREASSAGELGPLLQLSVGCTRIRTLPSGMSQPTIDRPDPSNLGATVRPRRAVASGGALYPSEVYVCAASEALPGVYHYDVARHELVELSAEPAGSRLDEALPRPAARCLVLVVTCAFWKSFCKYGDFAYRLGAVDVGIAIARLERLARERHGETRVHFDFDDEALDRILGIDSRDESAYAAIVVERRDGSAAPAQHGECVARPVSMPTPRQRSKRIKRSLSFDAMHASVLRGGGAAPFVDAAPKAPLALESILLPMPSSLPFGELGAIIRARTSNGPQLTGRGVTAEALVTVLAAAAEALARLHRAAVDDGLPAPRPWVIVQRVAGVRSGAYAYDADARGLVPVQSSGEALGLALQACSNLDNINLDLAAFTLHVVDDLDFRGSVRGNRSYRVQQMLVGAALDGAMLACSALGLGCHPMLGFDAAGIDALYRLTDTGTGVLAQLCVGVARPGHWLEGDVSH